MNVEQLRGAAQHVRCEWAPDEVDRLRRMLEGNELDRAAALLVLEGVDELDLRPVGPDGELALAADGRRHATHRPKVTPPDWRRIGIELHERAAELELPDEPRTSSVAELIREGSP